MSDWGMEKIYNKEFQDLYSLPSILTNWLTNWLTDWLKQSPSWEANCRSAREEIPRLLRNPKAHYCIHKRPPLVPFLRQMHAFHSFPLYFPKINSGETVEK